MNIKKKSKYSKLKYAVISKYNRYSNKKLFILRKIYIFLMFKIIFWMIFIFLRNKRIFKYYQEVKSISNQRVHTKPGVANLGLASY